MSSVSSVGMNGVTSIRRQKNAKKTTTTKRRHQKKEVNIELSALAKKMIRGISPAELADEFDVTRLTLISHLKDQNVTPEQVWRFKSTVTGKFLPLPDETEEAEQMALPLVAA